MVEPDQPGGADQSRSREFHRRALDVFPGGVSHNIRYFSPHPIYVERAEGSRIWDADGNAYVDFWMNHMASVLGHAHPDVVEAVSEQASNGLHYGAVNERALELGERVQGSVPSAERVRFCASGTEATMYAVRLARAHTGNDYVLKAEGGWHGGNTDLTKAIHAPFDEPASAGLPPGTAEHTLTYPVNDREAVEGLLDRYEGEVATVIVEPWLLAGGGLSVDDEFLAFLADASERRGLLLTFDEVVTGFRVSPGSYQARIDVTPDLTTLGKSLGGGLPVGALAGRADLFEAARPDVEIPSGKAVVAGGGTFSMNPMTATAGHATLDVIESEPVFEHTESQAERVRSALAEQFADLGVDGAVVGESSMFLAHFNPEASLESVAAIETDTDREALFAYHRRLIDRGYYFLPGHVGAVSYQTSERQLDGFLEASRTVLSEMQADGLV